MSVDTSDFLNSHKFLFHKSCSDRNNQQKLERAISKRPKTAVNDVPIANTEPVSGVRTRQSSGSVITTLGVKVCMICEEGDQFEPRKPDPSKKLYAAGNKNLADRSYPQKLTHDIRDMAIAVGKRKLAARLGLDVGAAELFYHPSCMRDLKNEYNRVKLKTESKDSSDESIKDDPLANFPALETLRYHLLGSPLNHFTCSELEKVYLETSSMRSEPKHHHIQHGLYLSC